MEIRRRLPHLVISVIFIAIASTISVDAEAQTEVGDPFVGYFVGPVLAAQWELGQTLDLTIGIQASAKYFAVDRFCGMHDPNPYGGATVGLQYSFWRGSFGIWALARGGFGSTFLHDLGLGVGPHLEWRRQKDPIWGLQTAQSLMVFRFRQVWNAGPLLLHAEFFPKIPVHIPEICHYPPYNEG